MTHLGSEQLEAYILDPVPGDVESHLGTCDACRERLVREARLELQLAKVAHAKAAAPSRRRRNRARVIAAVAACAVVIVGVFAIRASHDDDDVRPLAVVPPDTSRPAVRPPPLTPVAPKPEPPEPAPPSASALRGEEIEEMASKSGAAWKACFARSRNPPSKVVVTIEVAPDGDVAKVYSSDEVLTTRYVFAHTPLGRCIDGVVRRWKFRVSSGGTYRFTLVWR